MSKPDDIPQDIWDVAQITAKEATRESMRDPLMPYFVTVAPFIARAILVERRRTLPDEIDVYRLIKSAPGRSYGEIAKHIAAALRQGEP